MDDAERYRFLRKHRRELMPSYCIRCNDHFLHCRTPETDDEVDAAVDRLMLETTPPSSEGGE